VRVMKRGHTATNTERKRRWRARNPEASRTAERERAKARRQGFWGDAQPGVKPKPCASHDSYWHHEHSDARMSQRLWYTKLGAGAHRLTKKQRRAAIKAWGAAKMDALREKFGAESINSILSLVSKRVA
jgi:hypothetical protein